MQSNWKIEEGVALLQMQKAVAVIRWSMVCVLTVFLIGCGNKNETEVSSPVRVPVPSPPPLQDKIRVQAEDMPEKLKAGDNETEVSSPVPAPVPSPPPLQDKIRVQAQDMQEKFMAGDLDGFVSYIHPDVVEGMGGADRIKKVMAPTLSTMIESIDTTSIGEISDVIEDGDRLVAFVPVETSYKFPDGSVLQKSYRIACSADDGQTWTFLDGQGSKDQEDYFRSMFPVLTKQIPFPETGSIIKKK
jgi:hypothetical protein